ncbi:MAG: LysM peptidoglycan-binding domain-containing protein, partial [Anaerolineae bacterium]
HYTEKAVCMSLIHRKNLILLLWIVLLGLLPPRAHAQGITHTVSAGETVMSIAQSYGVDMQELIELNNLADPSMINVGQTLLIPDSIEADPTATSTAPAPTAVPTPTPIVTHTIAANETFGQVAKAYGITVRALAEANHIQQLADVQPGQQLIIPLDAVAPAARLATQGNLLFTVNITRQSCQLLRNGAVLYNWACSTGREEAATRAGTYYVQSKYRNAWGSRWEFFMPYWLGIYWAAGSENGIHGLPYQQGGYPVWGNSLGTPVTFGCVLLGEEESETLWNMAYIGMPVVISF